MDPDGDETRSAERFQSDPLLDEADESEFEPRKARASASTESAKKVIIDDSVAEAFITGAQEVPVVEEAPMEVTEEMTYVALTVLAKHQPFPGDALFAALKASHLYHGNDNLFHRHVNDHVMQSTLYSVLSLVNPGVFDIDIMSDESYPGIILLMTLSSRTHNPLVVFEKMLNNARQLAVTLNGELCDVNRKPLTAPMMSQLREKIQKNHRKSLQSTSNIYS